MILQLLPNFLLLSESITSCSPPLLAPLIAALSLTLQINIFFKLDACLLSIDEY